MPGRKYSVANTNYRYGFNGKENDNEVKGEGNQQDYGMRIYDPRLGRFLSTDPLTQQYPELTPYQFSSNNPIAGVDMDGLEFLTSYKAYQTQKFNAEILYQTTFKPASNSAPSSPPKPVITPVHSEASIPLQQLKARANAMRPVSPEEQNRKSVAEMAKRTRENQATVSAAKPPGPANDFEAGAVQGVYMTGVAVAAEYCPTCFIAYGGTQVYNGIKNNDPSQIVTGSLNIVGGGIIKAGTTSSAVNIPARLARVIPEEFAGSSTLGKAGSVDVFVADASQLKGLTTSEQIAQKLTLQNSDGSLMKGPFRVIEFDAPSSGVAQPFNRNNPGFINGGNTAGGATEYVIPNSNIADLKNVTQTTIH